MIVQVVNHRNASNWAQERSYEPRMLSGIWVRYLHSKMENAPQESGSVNLWLDLPSLARSLLIESQELALTKYFTARISLPESKRKRQSDYIEALQAHCGASIEMFWGHYQSEPWTCRSCGQTEIVPHEKKTDVNIAVEMMTDAFANAFDSALLISADSDLVPPIVSLRRLFPEKRIAVAFTPPTIFS